MAAEHFNTRNRELVIRNAVCNSETWCCNFGVVYLYLMHVIYDSLLGSVLKIEDHVGR
jgi:hypothetical protein